MKKNNTQTQNNDEEEPKTIQIQENNKFISFENTSENALQYFFSKLSSNSKGIIITRTKQTNSNKNIEIKTYKELFEDYDLNIFKEKIKQILTKNKKTILFLDRVDYLIGMFSFEETIKTIYDINDIEQEKTTIIRVAEDSLTKLQKGKLKAEFRLIPKPEVFNQMKLQNDLFELLLFIDTSETKISFKQVCKQFNITKATARKRIYDLYAKGLIFIKTDGRSKIISLNKEGQQLCRDLS